MGFQNFVSMTRSAVSHIYNSHDFTQNFWKIGMKTDRTAELCMMVQVLDVFVDALLEKYHFTHLLN